MTSVQPISSESRLGIYQWQCCWSSRFAAIRCVARHRAQSMYTPRAQDRRNIESISVRCAAGRSLITTTVSQTVDACPGTSSRHTTAPTEDAALSGGANRCALARGPLPPQNAQPSDLEVCDRLAAATACWRSHADTLMPALYAAASTRARSSAVNRTGTGADRRCAGSEKGLPREAT